LNATGSRVAASNVAAPAPGDAAENRAFGDADHSAQAGQGLGFNQQKGLQQKGLQQKRFAVEAKMERVSALMAYVVNEGRVCALKPSEWSLLLAGVALCGFATLVFLISGL
jgi:hypothetical protein